MWGEARPKPGDLFTKQAGHRCPFQVGLAESGWHWFEVGGKPAQNWHPFAKKQRGLPILPHAFVGGYLEDKFPLQGTPLSGHVSGRKKMV